MKRILLSLIISLSLYQLPALAEDYQKIRYKEKEIIVSPRAAFDLITDEKKEQLQLPVYNYITIAKKRLQFISKDDLTSYQARKSPKEIIRIIIHTIPETSDFLINPDKIKEEVENYLITTTPSQEVTKLLLKEL